MADPHIPVLLNPLLRAVAPVGGVWLDGTFGAGGYARGLLAAGADKVIGVDRDPSVFAMADAWRGEHGDRLTLVEGTFSDMDRLAGEKLDGVVLDLGVSSMQLDQADRGFSFMRDGPLDMRMGGDVPSAADLLNTAEESVIADVLYHYGEERASRRIAKAIVRGTSADPHGAIGRSGRILPAAPEIRPEPSRDAQLPGDPHLGERRIRPAGRGAFRGRTRAEARRPAGGRQLPFAGGPDRQALPAGTVGCGRGGEPLCAGAELVTPAFTMPFRRAIGPDPDELDVNPRARSALLRVGVRTDAPAGDVDAKALAMPRLPGKGKG